MPGWKKKKHGDKETPIIDIPIGGGIEIIVVQKRKKKKAKK
jgi:hypothetical protein